MTVKELKIDNSLDTILHRLGDFGKYQIYVVSLVSVAITIHAIVHMTFVFTAMDLDYRCKIPSCDSPENPSFSPKWLANAIPFSHDHPDKCFMFKQLPNDTGLNANCLEDDFNKNIVERCDSFVYESDKKSILQEYNLQCDDNLWKLALVGTINNIGQFFGLILTGYISDRFGRRFLLVWGTIPCALIGCIKALMPTYTLFLLCEFLEAVFASGSYICIFLLGVELVGPKKRVLTTTILSSSYAIGVMLLAAVAWMVDSWKHLVLVCYIPAFLFLAFLWLMPESLRWNLSKGHVGEAKQTLRKLAKVNGKQISEKELEILDIVVQERRDSSGNVLKSKNPFVEAAKSRTLMIRLILCCFCWSTCTFLFYGLTLNSVSLVSGNKYLDFMLTAVVEIPAYFTFNFVVERFGRKSSLCYSYLLTGISCLAFLFIPSSSRIGSLSAYLIGKFGATFSFTVLYVITSEMFPTNLRHSFMGVCSTFGRTGSMVAPQIPLLAKIWEPLPLVSFAGMSITAGLMTLAFPETINKKLPDTIKEAEDIGKAPSLPVNVKLSVDYEDGIPRF